MEIRQSERNADFGLERKCLDTVSARTAIATFREVRAAARTGARRYP
jgi:hypothetical protein